MTWAPQLTGVWPLLTTMLSPLRTILASSRTALLVIVSAPPVKLQVTAAAAGRAPTAAQSAQRAARAARAARRRRELERETSEVVWEKVMPQCSAPAAPADTHPEGEPPPFQNDSLSTDHGRTR